MQFRTEDLLTLRDGEPGDAALRARVLADPAAVRALEALERRKAELAALPELVPSRAADARVLAAMQTVAGARPARRTRRTVAIAAVAAAASLAVAALLFLAQPRAPAGTRSEDYRALIEESRRLERALFALPPPRTVMTVGTVGTIVSLEDQIARIDTELTLASATELRDEQRAALWRERVDVMNALVQVRYARSPVFDY
jgi:hypothetical protein